MATSLSPTPIADAATLHHRPTHARDHAHATPPPYRRRLHWTPPFAGCDSDNLLCGSGSACEAAVAIRHHHSPPTLLPNPPHHPPATFIQQPCSATTGPLLLQCPWTSALPNASVAPTVRLLRRPQQSLPLLCSTRTRRRLRFTCHLHGTRNLHRSSKEASHSRHHQAPLATKDT
jgi:hypothetical protein